MLDQKFVDKEEAKTALFDYKEVFYNRKRKHSALGIYHQPYLRKNFTNWPIKAGDQIEAIYLKFEFQIF